MTDWKKYYRMIVRKKWIIILITVSFVSLASYVSLYMIVPQYQASTRLFVLINGRNSSNEITYEQLMSGQLFLKNYNELIMSRAVTSEVIKNLNLTGITDEELADRITVDLLPDSSMMLISVQHESPRTVVEIANEVSNVFIQKATEILMTSNVSLVDKAISTEKPVYPRPVLIIGFSLVAGIMLSLGLILVLVYLDDTIGHPEEVEKKTGIQVIGIIPDMKIR